MLPNDRRIIDVGCGTGRYLQQFKAAGLVAVGVEYSPKLRRVCENRSLAVYPFDVEVPTPHPQGAPFDLPISIEVAEHIPATLADEFVKYFKDLAQTVVFTVAQPG
jgi:SAM-dependent methyltransferase